MLKAEADEGRAPIWPSNKPDWLHIDDWIGWPVLSVKEGEVHIIAILSARAGAFRDLIRGIEMANLRPVVVEPFPQMLAIMRRWKWKKRTIGSGWSKREEWRPS